MPLSHHSHAVDATAADEADGYTRSPREQITNDEADDDEDDDDDDDDDDGDGDDDELQSEIEA
jgi:hypothetical protein